MSTVAILGAGELGGAIAHALAARGAAARVLLIDPQGQVAAGKALDIQQSGAISGFTTRLEGATDPTRVVGCSVCVVADRAGPTPSEWRRDEAWKPWRDLRATPARRRWCSRGSARSR